MRIPFLSMFMASPFEGLQEHAEKVKEVAWAFQQAMECYVVTRCKTFEELRREVLSLEREANAIERRIRGHIPKGTLMPVRKFQLLAYLKEQDSVLDAVENAINWISYRPEPGVHEELQQDFFLLVDAAVEPIEELARMVSEAGKYFRNFSEKHRKRVKDIVRNVRQMEHDADKLEHVLKKKVFSTDCDPVSVFHLVRLAETIGFISDHAQNAGEIMRAMLSK